MRYLAAFLAILLIGAPALAQDPVTNRDLRAGAVAPDGSSAVCWQAGLGWYIDEAGTCDAYTPGSDERLKDRGVREVEDFLAGGTDYGAAIVAAYLDCVADGNDQCIGVVPRLETMTQSTEIDLCRQDLGGPQVPFTLVGHGSNRGGASGSLITATSSLRPAAVTGTFASSANTGFGGRDQITRATGSFLGSFERGDYFTSSGFVDAAANITDSEIPLLVVRVEALALTVELGNALDAGLTTQAGAAASIQRLAFQFRSCSKTLLDGVAFGGDATNRYADLGVVYWTDNTPADACSAAGVPYSHCTGSGTSSFGFAITTIGSVFQGAHIADQKWACFVMGSTNNMGQADATAIRDTVIHGCKIDVWADNLQAKPNLLLDNVDINNYEKYGVYSSSGGVHAFHSGYISGVAACLAGTYGECWAHFITNQNHEATTIDASVLEIAGGHGIFVQAGSSRQPFNFTNNIIWGAYSSGDPTPIKLLDFDHAGLLNLSGTQFKTPTFGPAVAPTIDIKNSNEATAALILTANPLINGSTSVPVMTIHDFLPNHAIPTISHATDCETVTTGTRNQLCIEVDAGALWQCQPIAATGATEQCDTAAEWFGPI